MIIDVILPTFNREALLARTLESLLAAEVPQGLEVRVLVVDNASTDGTTNVVAASGHASTAACDICTSRSRESPTR